MQERRLPVAAPEPPGPNAEQIRYWNEVSGPKWVADHRRITAITRPFGARAMDRAAIAPGDRVLDVGCGCGETTLEIARRAGAAGAVTGVDVSAPMLEVARRAAREAGLQNVVFEDADAQTADLPAGAFDVLYSRFGVMFFADPGAAFANLRRALRPGARLAFACWRALEENPWIRVPLAAVAQRAPFELPAPGAPGPFAFADAARTGAFLRRAGFEDVAVEPADELLLVAGGAPLDETTDFVLEIGLIANALRSADPETRARTRAAVRDALAPHAGAEGVRLGAAGWIVTGAARRV